MEEIREMQKCFYSDGFMFCNFVIRKDKVIKGRSGWLKFPVQYKKKNKIATPIKS